MTFTDIGHDCGENWGWFDKTSKLGPDDNFGQWFLEVLHGMDGSSINSILF